MTPKKIRRLPVALARGGAIEISRTDRTAREDFELSHDLRSGNALAGDITTSGLSRDTEPTGQVNDRDIGLLDEVLQPHSSFEPYWFSGSQALSASLVVDPCSPVVQPGWVKNRIREWMDLRGMRRQDLARRVVRKVKGRTVVGTSVQQIGRLINSRRKLSQDWLEALAPALDCLPTDLLPKETRRPESIPLQGYVGAGAKYWPDPAAGPWVGFDAVEAPGASTLVAVRVRGDSMEPVYRDGDILCVDTRRDRSPATLTGKDCIVQVCNGPTYIKTLRRGSRRDRYRLESYKADPINDVEVEWASPVLWIKRG